ncbi:MAG: 50S ribosomal protein L9 [Clostridia bacterium]|nr:50S ribosomal protein L9 [Clostridia bacterium]
MKVILLQDVKSQGKKDQIINVSDGYAVNFLFPRKLAAPADKQSIASVERRKAAEARQIAKDRAAAKELATRLDSLLVKIPSSANQGKLYGAITAQDIANALQQDHQIEIDKRKIILKDPIKTFGNFDVEVKLYSEVVGVIHVLVCEKA